MISSTDSKVRTALQGLSLSLWEWKGLNGSIILNHSSLCLNTSTIQIILHYYFVLIGNHVLENTVYWIEIIFFTITEQILPHWLGKSYGLWEYPPWKWRNMSRMIFQETSRETQNKINVIVNNKSTTIFHGLHSYRP